MKKGDIIINSIEPVYDVVGYDEVLESPLYKLKSVTVECFLKHEPSLSIKYNIITTVNLKEDEIKDKIIEVLQ